MEILWNQAGWKRWTPPTKRPINHEREQQGNGWRTDVIFHTFQVNKVPTIG